MVNFFSSTVERERRGFVLGYLTPPPAPAPVIVYKDVGGLVSEYEAQTEIYRRDNREVRLHECRSACTMALSLPNVCVYPDAQVKFHQAYNAITRETDYGVSAQLFAAYPEAVQARLGHLTRQYHVLSGLELIALGVRNCNGGDGVMVASRKPTKPPLSGTDPLADIAQNVRAVVASAVQSPAQTPIPPIRVAVVDRRPIPQTMARLLGDGDSARLSTAMTTPASREGFSYATKAPDPAETAASVDDIPQPPRRPPSIAFNTQDALPVQGFARLIAGAQPIVDNTRFAPRNMAAR